ncbi:MAG TPA: NIPSNAP family protein [Vicinamibacterales bacterium]|nr:NIPSNAP family protein [Vicinamibacterales bacterium]
MSRAYLAPFVAAAIVAASVGLHAQAGQAPAAPAPTPPCGPGQPASSKSVAKTSRCFELRTYTVQDGSSIELLHSRFREHTSKLFTKHGMTIIGFWQSVEKPNTLVYILAYPDNAARDRSWAAFNTDPEWVKTRTEMAVRVRVESSFMGATDYSPIK